MSIELTWYGHGSWLISTDRHKILLDPFLDESPTAPLKAAQAEADFILVSHGHFDHMSDVASIARRTQAAIIGIFEIAHWFSEKQKLKNTLGMNIGGQTQQAFGTIKMTQALHSSQLPDGSDGGHAGGFLLTIDGKRIYFACDTALFSDMQLIGNESIDLAILPIGDLFTMGPEDSVRATNLIQPKQVLPAHYNTWPPINQNAKQWAELITAKTQSQALVLQPGETHSI
jgi:L-ascorbate metabolism protein UlaG (beta-lactamase superfamily)